MNRSGPAALLLTLLFLAPAARAQDPVAALTALVRESAASPNPTLAFVQGLSALAALPDFELDPQEVAEALEGVTLSDGALKELLGTMTGLTKRLTWFEDGEPDPTTGRRTGRKEPVLSLQRRGTATTTTERGHVLVLGTTIRARVAARTRTTGGDRLVQETVVTLLENLGPDGRANGGVGIQLSPPIDVANPQAKRTLYDLWDITFTRNRRDEPVARIVVGFGILWSTEEVAMGPPPNAPSTPARPDAAPPGAPSTSLTPGLAGALDAITRQR